MKMHAVGTHGTLPMSNKCLKGEKNTVKPVHSDDKWFSRQIIVQCRSKVLQNAPRGASCNTYDLH